MASTKFTNVDDKPVAKNQVQKHPKALRAPLRSSSPTGATRPLADDEQACRVETDPKNTRRVRRVLTVER